MITRVAACGLLCLLTAACSVSPTRDTTSRDRTPSTSAVPAEPLAQESYMPAAMFQKAHGEYMLKREYWRPDVQASALGLLHDHVNSESGHFDLRHFRADIEQKVYLPDPDSFLGVGLQYGHRSYQFSSPTPNGTHDEDLFRASALLRVGHFVDQDTLVELDFSPGIWSDLSRTLHREDWQFHGRGLLTWRATPDVFLMGGLEVSTLFQRPDVYPLLGVAWAPDPAWRVDILLPRQARVTYQATDHTSVYFGLDLDGGEYQITSPTAATGPSNTRRKVAVQEMEASLGAQHRFNTHFSSFLRVGTTIGGHYHFVSNGPAVYDGQVVAQLFAEAGFGWYF